MPETRKLAAILAADVAGYSKLAGTDEERMLARLRALRSDLIDPNIAVQRDAYREAHWRGRSIIEFRSVVDAVRCAQRGVERHGREPEVVWPTPRVICWGSISYSHASTESSDHRRSKL